MFSPEIYPRRQRKRPVVLAPGRFTFPPPLTNANWCAQRPFASQHLDAPPNKRPIDLPDWYSVRDTSVSTLSPYFLGRSFEAIHLRVSILRRLSWGSPAASAISISSSASVSV